MKITVGNFLEGMERGARAGVMIGGVGPCRLGYYCAVQRQILERLNPSFRLFVFEPSLQEIRKTAGELFGNVPWYRYVRALSLAWAKLQGMDIFDEVLWRLRAREKRYGQSNEIAGKFYEEVRQTQDIQALIRSTHRAIVNLHTTTKIERAERPLRVGIVGEMYMILEAAANQGLVEMLNGAGVEVYRKIYISQWIAEHVLRIRRSREVHKAAHPYVPNFIGGHGRESVGEAIVFRKEGMDGVIHLAPLTCSPEIVAQIALQSFHKRTAFPLLTLYMDEHSGKEGVKTRLEGFIDMLRWRRGDRPV